MKNVLDTLGRIPFGLGELATLYPTIHDIKTKARQLEQTRQIVRLKQGVYVLNPEMSGEPLASFLVANHLNGPSYVSLLSALRYYGLTPEGVYVVQSMTTKSNREYETPFGWFTYKHCDNRNFPIGIQTVQDNGVSFLMATPEKALCDLMATSPHLQLRYQKEIREYLEEDIRFDTDALGQFNISLLQDIAAVSTKPTAIRTLINYLR